MSDGKGNLARTVIIKNTTEPHTMFGVRRVPPAPSWPKEAEARAGLLKKSIKQEAWIVKILSLRSGRENLKKFAGQENKETESG